MKRPSHLTNWRALAPWLALSCGAVICLALLVLVPLVSAVRPVIDTKLESARYRLLELLPPPPHTEFVPTPIATLEVVSVEAGPTATPQPTQTSTRKPTTPPTPTLTPTPAVPVNPIQPQVRLTGVVHDYQRWNNCGPTTLEMYLSFFGIHDAQVKVASAMKPDPDDKNVRPDEMAAYAAGDGLQTLVRVNGTLDRLKLFLSNGLPLIVETGFDPPRAHQGWMGHYRLLTGYDGKRFITQDSYDGPNVMVDYGALDADWKAFNRTYILLFTAKQAPLVQAILGDDLVDAQMYSAAVARAQQESDANPKDAFAQFNLGSSLLGLKRYREASAAFDKARVLGLPWRMLWYQFGPYQAYLAVGRYQEVVALATATLKVVDDLEESHYYKGLALEALGQTTAARAEFAAALRYNRNYADAQRELANLTKQ